MQAGGAVQDRFYIFTAPLPPATAAANFFTLEPPCLAASSTWCRKEGKAEGTTAAAAAFVSLEKKTEDENTDRHLCKET